MKYFHSTYQTKRIVKIVKMKNWFTETAYSKSELLKERVGVSNLLKERNGFWGNGLKKEIKRGIN